MALHLLKLCVGAVSIADLEAWIEGCRADAARLKRPYEQIHTTLRAPKRADEILDGGGSLYWVIKGQISCRQRLADFRMVRHDDGIERCQLVLEEGVRPVVPRPCRPFQGWRYLEGKDAPGDLDAGSAEIADMPEEMRRELLELGLI